VATLFQNLSNTIHDPLIITDSQYNILYVNQATTDLLDYQAQDIISKCMSILFTKNDWVHFDNVCQGLITNPHQRLTPFNQTTTITSKQNIKLAPLISFSFLPVDNERFFIFIFKDFQHLDRKQEDIQQEREQHAQNLRLQAIGRLTTGLAHEYNNLLTSIVGYSDILNMRLNQDEASSRYLKHISEASNRATDLTRHLIAFSRHRSHESEMCELNTIITDVEKMIRGLFDDDTELLIELTPNLGMVRLDLGELLQILITTNNIQNINTSQPNPTAGSYTMLAIGYHNNDNPLDSDQSSNKSLNARELQTELEEVFNLVHKAGGYIEIAAESTKKKTYKIFFPTALHPSGNGHPEETTDLYNSGAETILIVDDEEMIRALIREALLFEGYHVLEAGDPEKALCISKHYEHPIHLLVSDVVMPGMNGRELADKLISERPHLRLLFISGHTANLLMRNGIDNLDGRFLQKPFSTSRLLEKVRLALDKSAG
jgi:PAS domain S-box-containing protein